MSKAVVLEVGVKAFITNQHGKYLFLLRAEPYPGQSEQMWDIPGGRITPGEATQEALKREIKEETGLQLATVLDILAVQDIQRVPGKHTVRITYLVRCRSNKNITLDPHEHSRHKWMSLDELSKLPHDLYLNPVLNTF